MAKLEKYRDAIKQVIRNYQQYTKADSPVEAQIMFDTEHDHYQLVHVGWEKQRRVYGCVLHFDIKNEKIWVQHNGTEGNVADELIDLGVDKLDIVLGFHSPYKRQFTEFAVG